MPSFVSLLLTLSIASGRKCRELPATRAAPAVPALQATAPVLNENVPSAASPGRTGPIPANAFGSNPFRPRIQCVAGFPPTAAGHPGPSFGDSGLIHPYCRKNLPAEIAEGISDLPKLSARTPKPPQETTFAQGQAERSIQP